MRDVIGLLALNACFVIWGYALLTLVRRPLSLADAGLAFCTGIGGLSTAACLVAVVGYVPGWIAVSIATAAVGTWLAYENRGVRLRRPSRPRPSGEALVGLVAGVYSVLLLRDAYVRPLAEWDAWAIWTAKARPCSWSVRSGRSPPSAESRRIRRSCR